MKGIAWLLDTFPSTSETFIARDIAALRSAGFKIDIFALNAGEGALPLHKRGLLRADWRQTGVVLGQRLARENYAHVHAGWASHPAEIAQAAAETAQIPWSFSAHARDIWVEGRNLRAKLASARFAHSCTRAGAQRLQEIDGAARVIHAPHGLELAQWPYQLRGRERTALLLGVGRLVPKKGWDVWLQALAVLQVQSPRIDWRARLIGDGPERGALVKLASNLGIERRLIFDGVLPERSVREALHEAQLLIFAGRTDADGDRDGLPNILLEAAALGTPIIATRAGAVNEFGDADAMWLCQAENPAALAGLMQRALDQWSQSLIQAGRARQIMEQRYDSHKAVAPLALELMQTLQRR